MTDNNLLHHESLSLYHFMCKHIVGTEETVKTKRLMITVKDNLTSDEICVYITSGSFGEGLEMEGSDLDLMSVCKYVTVHEDKENIKFDPETINLVMEMDDTKPGYTYLRCVNLPSDSIFLEMCTHKNKACYISSDLFKTVCMEKYLPGFPGKIHGPCLSDMYDSLDLAICLHNANWIQPAENWINRGNASWPNSEIRSAIINHGVLLVPIGSKESDNEALEWRISFSVGEKLLIFSFCHTQLLCYALMKILLSDLINSNNDCKNLLCSYFIKTIVFWVSEETAVTEWKPENLITCFMRCLRRLMYSVEYSMCPHFFIPIINMFENKIEGRSRQCLLEHLKTIFSFGWGCVFFSERFQNVNMHYDGLSITTEKKLEFQNLVTSKIHVAHFVQRQSYGRCFRQMRKYKSSLIKSIYLRNLSLISSNDMQSSSASDSNKNKRIYYHYRKAQSYLLQSVNHDAVSGWLMVSTWLYSFKQYSNALYILNNVLMKSTQDKVYNQKHLSQLEKNLVKSATLKRPKILRLLKHSIIVDVMFSPVSTLIPEELALDVIQDLRIIPPVVFAHFLCCLCHYHLNDERECYKSINDLHLTISKKWLISDAVGIGMGYNLLGIVLQVVDQNYLAEQAFKNATQYSTYLNSAAMRLLLMRMEML